MVDLTKLATANRARWLSMKIRPERAAEFAPVARRLCAAKARYLTVEKATDVPWWFTAVTHQRESSQSWTRSLAQGDPWDRVSIHVPAGRGPFKSWEDAAIDALVNCPPYAARNKDWSPGGAMTMLERYNGVGYANRGIPSPYVWSGTDQYASGKYVADGVFDPQTVDKQLGCAPLIKSMMAIDPSIKLAGPAKVNPIGPVIVAGGTAAATAHGTGFPWAAIAIGLAAAAVVAFIIWRNRK